MITGNINLDVADRIIVNYLVKKDDDYELYDEMNNELNRDKILRILRDTYFINPISREILRIIKAYYKNHSKIPRVREIIEKAELDLYDIDEATIKAFFEINLSEYAPEFILRYLKAFVITGSVNYSMINISTKLKTEAMDMDHPETILDYIYDQLTEIDLEFSDSARGLDVADPRSHIQADVSKKSTGFEYLDRVLGGWEPKTLIVFQGRPKVGKSLVLGNIAVRAAQQGLNVAVISVELGDRKYVKRLGSNLYDIPNKMYDTFTSDDDLPIIERLLNKKKEKHPGYGSIHVKEFPTDGVNSFEIETYLKNYETRENKKLDVVVIDYINLLQSSKKEDGSLYTKIKDIAQDLRKIAQRNQWTIVTATQVKLAHYNSDDLDMGSGAESSALVATVDSLFGLISPLAMNSEVPIEGTHVTLKNHMMRIKNLANRDGGNMESWALFDKSMSHFRLTETSGAGTTMYTDDLENRDGTPRKMAERMEMQHNAERVNAINVQTSAVNAPSPITNTMPDASAGMPTHHADTTIGQFQSSYENSPAVVPEEKELKANIRMGEEVYERVEGKDLKPHDLLKTM